MGIFTNLKNIKNIFCNGSEIQTVYVNRQIVYQSDEIDSAYNYFVFQVSPTAGKTIELSDDRRGDTTSYDGLTDWGDGTIDSKMTHTYDNNGTYIVKTKWMLKKTSSVLQTLIACNNVNKNITDVTSLFSGCKYLRTVDMSRFKTNHITDMSFMFDGCTSLESVNMKGWNTAYVTNMSRMFYNCHKLIPQVSHFNVSRVTNMQSMFTYCESIDGSQFKNWDVSSAINMALMFQGATITNCLDLYGWNVSSVDIFTSMFYGCKAKDGIDISYWNIKDTASVGNMFTNTVCSTCIEIEHHVTHVGVPTADWQRMKAGK